jgi:hypothetical protein
MATVAETNKPYDSIFGLYAILCMNLGLLLVFFSLLIISLPS